MKFIALVSVLIILSLGADAFTKFTAEDMHKLARMGDVVTSPDGSVAVFSVTKWTENDNVFTTSLYMADLTGAPDFEGKVKQITQPKAGTSDSQPAFGKDSDVVAFLSDRTGISQIFTLDLTTFEATQVSEFPVDVSNLHWSADGGKLAFTAEVYPGMNLQDTAKENERRANLRTTGFMFTDTFVRHWAVWFDDKWTHVFFATVPANDAMLTDATDLMKGIDGHCPSQPFGDRSEFGFSPNGMQLGFSTLSGKNKAWRTNSSVYLVSLVDDGFTPECITCDNPGRDIFAGFSSNGALVAMLSNRVNGYESDFNRLVIYDTTTGKADWVTDDWPMGVSGAQFLPGNDSELMISVEEKGCISSIYINRETHARVELKVLQDASILKIIPIKGNSNTFVIGSSSFEMPEELFWVAADNTVSRITELNDAELEDKEMVKPEAVWYEGANGDQVLGWFFKPAGFDPTQTYPLVMYIHGGPEGAWDSEWSTRWNPQTITNQGYALFAPNPHGSTGFGANFTSSIRNNWGGWPFEDIMDGLKYILGQYPFLDASKVVEMGASYGGYMGLWLQSHAPEDTFKAMVVHDGLFDLESFWASTDEMYFPEAEMGGPYYASKDEYAKWSPSSYIDEWKFPMMIVHGGHDYRIPVSQGIGAFQALQRRGLKSQFLHFPNASHFVLAPPDSIMWHDEIFKWFAQHL